jgi:hypothetical protein
MKKLIVVGMLLGLLPSYAFAGYETGQDILIACTGSSSDKEKALIARLHCLGYVDGVNDAHGLLSSLNPTVLLYCTPATGVSAGEVYDKVISYILKHDDAREMSGRTVIIKAMQEAYPCK